MYVFLSLRRNYQAAFPRIAMAELSDINTILWIGALFIKFWEYTITDFHICSGGSRIFPGGAPTPKVLLFFNFLLKLHENERIWTPGGARVPGAPLGSANDMRDYCKSFPNGSFALEHCSTENRQIFRSKFLCISPSQ